MLNRTKIMHGGKWVSTAYETRTYQIVVARLHRPTVSFTEHQTSPTWPERMVYTTRATAARILRCTLLIMAGKADVAQELAGAPL